MELDLQSGTVTELNPDVPARLMTLEERQSRRAKRREAERLKGAGKSLDGVNGAIEHIAEIAKGKKKTRWAGVAIRAFSELRETALAFDPATREKGAIQATQINITVAAAPAANPAEAYEER